MLESSDWIHSMHGKAVCNNCGQIFSSTEILTLHQETCSARGDISVLESLSKVSKISDRDRLPQKTTIENHDRYFGQVTSETLMVCYGPHFNTYSWNSLLNKNVNEVDMNGIFLTKPL
ncbi:hypothetical protein AB6A40_001648 [Gnathostoma spinigerum]|uniref:C2H2-type domain-containing protein n=1 Tax=Gnathostoma spinigerum TaxID=75299 RepID=A0ABD6E4N1_9BILA